MTSKIRALGPALLAIVALNMIAASPAHAGLGELHAEAGPSVDLTGEQIAGGQLTFKETGLNVRSQCTEAKVEGTIQDPNGQTQQTTATEVTLTPRFTGCEVFVGGTTFGTATVDMNGCKFTLTGGVTSLTAKVDIAGCTTGKQIVITTTTCTTDLPEQTGLSHVTFVNEGSGSTKDVEANITVQGISYELTGGFCPGEANVVTKDGDLEGLITIKAFKDQGTTTLKTHNGHQYNELICGQQVGLFAT